MCVGVCLCSEYVWIGEYACVRVCVRVRVSRWCFSCI